MNRLPTVLLTAMLTISAASTSAGAAEPWDGFDEFVVNQLERYGVPGAAVAIVQDDKVLVSKGYGVRAYGKPETVNENTLFMLASLTKSYTAALLATFVDEGSIGWDEPVITYLPEVVLYDPYPTRVVTTRDFLAHRSGLPPHGGNLLEALGYDRPEILRRLRYLKPEYTFREEAGYSNPGYMIAGMTAARVGGKSWEDLMRERILTPLGMTHSGLSHNDHEKTDNYASGHVSAEGGGANVIAWPNHDGMGPAGSITSTVSDQTHFLRMLLNKGTFEGKRLLSEEVIEQMFEPSMVSEVTFTELPPCDPHSGFSYGLGWNNFHYAGEEIIEKGGAQPGMRTIATLVPSKNFGIVILANLSLTALPEAIRAEALARLLDQPSEAMLKEIKEREEGIHKMLANRPKRAGEVLAPPTLPLEAFAGTYENDLYGTVEFYLDDGQLHWKAGPAEYGGKLTHANYNVFSIHQPPHVIAMPSFATFVIDADGKPAVVLSDLLGDLRRVDEKR
ncbi:D-alanyl-D-alanine carboxypeptidase precursor [Planctomycetes bacterium Pan216]|uniref:D-alanyl-D-alanine carboxypeptidase n=1 Tax=Kolteria novifilia TaxID=2527975 RepID=A0A518B4I9_9BACT|nr:D-alanyl-D-alanine carboxypeptidase precursor [Planctomycetes bacterium Pan216]